MKKIFFIAGTFLLTTLFGSVKSMKKRIVRKKPLKTTPSANQDETVNAPFIDISNQTKIIGSLFHTVKGLSHQSIFELGRLIVQSGATGEIMPLNLNAIIHYSKTADHVVAIINVALYYYPKLVIKGITDINDIKLSKLFSAYSTITID